MMERRKRPLVRERKLSRSPSEKRVVALRNTPSHSPDKTFEAFKGAFNQLQRSIKDLASAVGSARYAVSASEDLRRRINLDFGATNSCTAGMVKSPSESL
jgi:hypothetical protein